MQNRLFLSDLVSINCCRWNIFAMGKITLSHRQYMKEMCRKMEDVENIVVTIQKALFVSKEELSILSDGMLALIENTNKALEYTRDGKCVQDLLEIRTKYMKLNCKICSCMDEESTEE